MEGRCPPCLPGRRLSEIVPEAYAAVHEDVKAGRHAEYWLKGGRGSGKSSFVSVEILLTMLRHPDANAIIYRKQASTLRESVFEQMRWAAEALGIDGQCRFQLVPMEMEFMPTGQKILFRGADDPAKSKSIKLAKGYFGCLWFEELAEFAGMGDVRSIRASVIRGTPEGERAVTFCTYNPPESMRSWVNLEAMRPEADRLVHASTYLDLPREWLGEGFIAAAEQLKAANERLYRHMYLGESGGTGGQVFENVKLMPVEEGGRIYCGLDFGFAVDPDAFIRARFDRRTRILQVLDEFYAVRTPVVTLTEEVLWRAGDEVVRCDAADPRLIRELRAGGVLAVAAKKGAGSVAYGIRHLQELAEIRVDPKKCPNAARELVSYEYEPDGRGGFLPAFPDRDNHLIDALRYAMEPVFAERAARTAGGRRYP